MCVVVLFIAFVTFLLCFVVLNELIKRTYAHMYVCISVAGVTNVKITYIGMILMR